ncbi:hypothetical protein [Frankia gtarii]|uniref:hypothetical protein n=1 Tax=Frankia gtarii TaxID=2950102 RepID=UPI0021BE3AAF|nr:hypothetical protein [Frankia gtarii]
MHRLLLFPVDPNDDTDRPDEPVARAILLASLITGITPSRKTLTGPMLAAEFDPWFTGTPPQGNALHADPTSRSPYWNTLDQAVTAATPTAKRATAIAETQRIADLLDLADTPGLTDALADAAAGRFPTVPATSPLGREVRRWLRLSSTASWSLNDSTARISTAEYDRGLLLGWFTAVLRGTLHPDPDIAARTALHPLACNHKTLADPAAQAAALSHLRS